MTTLNDESRKRVDSYVTKQQLKNSLTVDGYIHDIGLDENIPLELYKLCETFCYIDIKPYIIDTDFRKVYRDINTAFDDHNLLLAKELALYQLNINQRDAKQNMFHNIVAMINEELKLASDAEYHYTKAIEIQPRQAVYYWNFASLLKFQQRYAEAIQLLKKGMKYDCQQEKLCYLFAIAECFEKSDEMDQALLYYQQMADTTITMLGGDNNGKNYLLQAVGFIKCEQIIFTESTITINSEECYQQYLKVVDRDKVTGNTSYAKLLWTLGKNEEALKYLNKAFDTKRYNAITWYVYGMVMKETEECDEALVAFQNALDLCAVFKECKSEFDKLKESHLC